MTTIALTHDEHGPMMVRVHFEASFWARRRQWICDDAPELGYFDDAEFDEHVDLIDAMLEARSAADRARRLEADNRRLRELLLTARHNIVQWPGNPVIAEIDAVLEMRP